jgi:hypothetical protein
VSGNRRAIAATLTNPNANGILQFGVTVNNSQAVTPTGGITETDEHQDQTGALFTVMYAEQVGSLANPATPGASWGTSGRNAAVAFVVSPAGDDQQLPDQPFFGPWYGRPFFGGVGNNRVRATDVKGEFFFFLAERTGTIVAVDIQERFGDGYSNPASAGGDRGTWTIEIRPADANREPITTGSPICSKTGWVLPTSSSGARFSRIAFDTTGQVTVSEGYCLILRKTGTPGRYISYNILHSASVLDSEMDEVFGAGIVPGGSAPLENRGPISPMAARCRQTSGPQQLSSARGIQSWSMARECSRSRTTRRMGHNVGALALCSVNWSTQMGRPPTSAMEARSKGFPTHTRMGRMPTTTSISWAARAAVPGCPSRSAEGRARLTAWHCSCPVGRH